MSKPCRHRHFWAFKAISVKLPMLWCYQCGAIKNGEDKWVRPTGADGTNPAMAKPVLVSTAPTPRVPLPGQGDLFEGEGVR